MVIWYYPIAYTVDGERLFTYDSTTKEKALKQFSIWEDHYGYKIKEAYLQDNNGNRIIDVEKRWVAKEGDSIA